MVAALRIFAAGDRTRKRRAPCFASSTSLPLFRLARPFDLPFRPERGLRTVEGKVKQVRRVRTATPTRQLRGGVVPIANLLSIQPEPFW